VPPTIHLTVTAAVGPTAAEFASDLAGAVAAASAHGPVEVPSLPALDPGDVTQELVAGLAGALGLGGGDFGRMAGVNTLLNASPPALREALLTGFLSLLQRPPD
jgi:sphinganine-1-phosphate aldolase